MLVTATDMPKADPETPLLAAALRERGVDAPIVGWDADHPWGEADLVVLRSPWDYVDRLEEFLSWCDDVAATTRLTNSATTVRWNAHKGYLQSLIELGVPTVPTLLVAAGAALPDLAGVFPDAAELVVKPAVSVGANGTERGQASSEALQHHLRDLTSSVDALVQPLVESVLREGETSLLFAGGLFSHAIRKIPAPGDFRVQDHHGGSVHTHEATNAEMTVAARALAAAPEPASYARVDLVAIDGQPMVMELELIEPELFLRMDPDAPGRFAEALLAILH